MSRQHHGLETCNKAEAFEVSDDVPANPCTTPTIGDVINRRYGRRDVLRGMLGVSAVTALFGTTALTAPGSVLAQQLPASRFVFDEIEGGVDETHHVAEGYDARVLIRWGDPITAEGPDFDPQNQSVAAQLAQFGYNNDYIAYFEIEPGRGLLCVNHEYTNEEVMFPGVGRQDRSGFDQMTRALVDIEMAAHGVSIFEVRRSGDGTWSVVREGSSNRRITPYASEMTVSGPAAGHDRLKTLADPTGLKIIGTLNNCAGGKTPWGTYLTAEENFHGYFWTDKRDAQGRADVTGFAEEASLRRYGVPGLWYNWGQYDDRFNLDREPTAANRFGWIVEIDPFDPTTPPIKHTALGRFSHEGCETTVSGDGRVVVYSGDDRRFEYVYKFVSAGKLSGDKSVDRHLLSDGTLYVARFNEDGTLDWLPMIYGQGPLTAENGFASQADVVIDARLAADRLGATPMDRPEDVEPRGDGTVFVMLTNNDRRKSDQVDAANPRPENLFGHIIEIKEADGDHAATRGRWDIVVKCGDPSVAEVGARWHPATSQHGWFASPDNCAIDADGRLWISTDQGSGWGRTGRSDGLYALETDGALRGHAKHFFRCPVGAELCGPYFTQDLDTLFLAVQHPGTDGTRNYKGFERDSTFEDPATRWPDFQDGMPPRPSVVVITRNGGGKIAG
ncbi:MAG: PhoX family phosphatase [Hyphomicrobiaceae bacterium]